MDTILQCVEDILAGLDPDTTDLPVSEVPDYLPRMCDGGGGYGAYC
jgi:hypothetical protein